MTDTFSMIPPGVKAISTRGAAQMLGCSTGHIRHLAAEGRLGKVYRVTARALMLDLKAVKAYQKSIGPRGRPRSGYSFDT